MTGTIVRYLGSVDRFHGSRFAVAAAYEVDGVEMLHLIVGDGEYLRCRAASCV